MLFRSEQAPTETQAILTVEARSIRDPSLIFSVDHSATIAGASGSGPTGPSEDEPSAFVEFIRRWLETILILVISVIGSVGLALAIRHRIEKERGWHRRNNPEDRSEEHTSELQSRRNLVCRLLLEKKN